MKFSENSKPENSSNSNSDSNYNQGRMGGNFPAPGRVDTGVDTSVDPPNGSTPMSTQGSTPPVGPVFLVHHFDRLGLVLEVSDGS